MGGWSPKDAAEDDQFLAESISILSRAKGYVLLTIDKNGVIDRRLASGTTSNVVSLIGAMEIELLAAKQEMTKRSFAEEDER